MFILIALMALIFLIVALLLRKVKKFRDKVTRKLKDVRKKLIFNGAIRSVYLTYMKMAIGVADQLAMWAYGSDFSTDPSSAFACLTYISLVPVAAAVFLLCKAKKDKNGVLQFEALGKEEARKKYGNLYTDISIKRARVGGVLFFPVFMARRLFFVLCPKLFLYQIGF